jgi:hypothetical protein
MTDSEFEGLHPRDVNGLNKGQFIAKTLDKGDGVDFDGIVSSAEDMTSSPASHEEYELSEDELEEWLEDTGLGSAEAQEWARAEFGIDDAAYLSAHCNVEEAIEWRDEGFSASDTVRWSRVKKDWSTDDLTAKKAKEWSNVDHRDAMRWVNLFGSSDPQVSQEWRDEWLTPTQYEQWYEFDARTARDNIDAGVDFDTAQAELHKQQAELHKQQAELRAYWAQIERMERRKQAQ